MSTRDQGKNLSSEEEDLINRNRKKMKDGDDNFTIHTSGLISYADLEILDDGNSERPNIPDSFKNAVLRQDQDGSHVLTIEESPINKAPSDMDMTDQVQEINQPQQGSSAMDSSFEKDPDGDEACLVVKIPKIERERMARPLDNTLIIKLLGINIGFNFLEKKIKELWAPKGEIEIIDLPCDYFFVKFTHVDDYNFALYGGPWIILDHYLTVRKWFSKFDPETDKITSISAWIRFPKLPFDLFDHKFLTSFGNSIGKTIKIDITTTKQARGKFARMCVEIDLTKPLISKYKLDGKKYYIEYESIHMICFECGKYGHSSKNCPMNTIIADPSTEENVQETEAKEDAKFGPWMVVKKTRRIRKAKTTSAEKGDKQNTDETRHQPQGGATKKGVGGDSKFKALASISSEDDGNSNDSDDSYYEEGEGGAGNGMAKLNHEGSPYKKPSKSKNSKNIESPRSLSNRIGSATPKPSRRNLRPNSEVDNFYFKGETSTKNQLGEHINTKSTPPKTITNPRSPDLLNAHPPKPPDTTNAGNMNLMNMETDQNAQVMDQTSNADVVMGDAHRHPQNA